MKIYNSLSRKTEDFKTIKNHEILMYVCGPTVYDRIHLGNARSIMVFDFIYRSLRERFSSQEVKYIRNITDVDDKIINRARELNISEVDLSEQMIKYFHQDLEYLNCLTPTKEPKVTEEIQECILMIKKIIANGFGYEKDGNVLFSVSRYELYGKLSGRETQYNINATREIKEVDKDNLNDFILWKKTDIGITWDSPWGKGRPGWHIECSAMSYKYLGENFDIHGGGMDLKFPHHENEIAQSKCANLNSSFANYWLHNGILTINGEKMSKSLGNFITIADLSKKNINPFVIRMAILSANYKNSLDFNDKLIYDWEIRLKEIINILQKYSSFLKKDYKNEQVKTVVFSYLNDDFNSNGLIRNIIKNIEIIKNYENDKYQNIILDEFINIILYSFDILGIDIEKYLEFEKAKLYNHPNYQKVCELAVNRIEAKKQKNFQQADEIRREIQNLGFKIEDLPEQKFNLSII